MLRQRSDALSRSFRGSRADFARTRDRARRLYQLVFEPSLRAGRRWLSEPSWRVLKLWFAVESRAPLGSTQLRVRYAEELLAVAIAP